jgi:pseudaminic acid synthase
LLKNKNIYTTPISQLRQSLFFSKFKNTYIIAELSANHNQDLVVALKLVEEAAKAGANAIKLQTYTADTITIDCRTDIFRIKGTHLWDDQYLYDLYKKAYTPWEWHSILFEKAHELGMDAFSSPFDTTAVDFLESLNVPCYKIASCEITDHILLRKVGQTGKPVIISSGMASKEELQEAVDLLREWGTPEICMLKCTAEYPARQEDANLVTIRDMISTFNVIGGLSDHTLGMEVPVAAVCLGAKVVEKHFTLSRSSGSPDDAFSLTPEEFKLMVETIRTVEKTIGSVTYGGVKGEEAMKKFRRSLFFVKPMKEGDIIDESSIRSIRPGNGLHTKHYCDLLGKSVKTAIPFGTPVSYNLIKDDLLE